MAAKNDTMIRVRVPLEARDHLKVEASLHGMDLATYLRHLIVKRDPGHGKRIAKRMEDLKNGAPPNTPPATMP